MANLMDQLTAMCKINQQHKYGIAKTMCVIV